MEIKRLVFEKKEIEIRETYVGEDGRTRERIKKVMVPTGKCLGFEDGTEAKASDECESKED